jgi:hypothetical protein
MADYTTPTTFYAQAYQANLVLLAQQMEPRLPMAAMQGNHRGSKAAVAIEQLGPLGRMGTRSARFEPVVLTDVAHYRRWIYQVPFVENIGFDDIDGMQMLQDPKGQYVTEMRAQLNREMDLAMINAFFATAITGETQQTNVTFPAGQIVAVDFATSGTNTGLTVKKLLEARRILRAAEVNLDYEEVYIAITAQQEKDLFGELQFTSGDFTATKKMDNGKVSQFLGFNFIHSEQIPLNPTYTGVPVWVKSGMHFGTWIDVSVKIAECNWLNWAPWKAEIKAAFGATRTEEKKVVEILCA